MAYVENDQQQTLTASSKRPLPMRMRPDLVVVSEPSIDCGLGLFDAVEPLRTQNFPAQCSVEAFVVSVLPAATLIIMYGLDSDPFEPPLKMLSYELWTIV